jgi:hypothetical protein
MHRPHVLQDKNLNIMRNDDKLVAGLYLMLYLSLSIILDRLEHLGGNHSARL